MLDASTPAFDATATAVDKKDSPQNLTIDTFLSQRYAVSVALAKRALSQTSLNVQLDAHGLVHQSYIRIREAKSDLPGAPPQLVQYLKAAFRSILVDAIREHLSEKRGAGVEHLDYDEVYHDSAAAVQASQSEQKSNLNEVLSALEQTQPRLAKLVELRFFVGLSEVEIAKKLGVSERTVRRDWQKTCQALREMIRTG
jgi:RNA polymerase sigma factor (TIGR02999 family)